MNADLGFDATSGLYRVTGLVTASHKQDTEVRDGCSRLRSLFDLSALQDESLKVVSAHLRL